MAGGPPLAVKSLARARESLAGRLNAAGVGLDARTEQGLVCADEPNVDCGNQLVKKEEKAKMEGVLRVRVQAAASGPAPAESAALLARAHGAHEEPRVAGGHNHRDPLYCQAQLVMQMFHTASPFQPSPSPSPAPALSSSRSHLMDLGVAAGVAADLGTPPLRGSSGPPSPLNSVASPTKASRKPGPEPQGPGGLSLSTSAEAHAACTDLMGLSMLSTAGSLLRNA